jgi:hypothetical protein
MMTAEAPVFQTFPTDVYDCLCKEITVEQKPADRYHEKAYQQLRCRTILKVDDDEAPDGYEWKSWTFWLDLTAGKGGKLNKYREAIGLPPVEPGEPFDTDEMTDKYFRVSLSDKKKDGSPGQQIMGWLPPKVSRAKATKNAPVADPSTEPEDDDQVPF